MTARRDEAETSVLVRQATTSDRNGLGLRHQPRNTQVITAKTIEEQQALNITDILRNAGGVSVLGNNPNSGASYTIRGFGAGGLVNGLTTSSQYGVAAGADQPVANIERVEILKGPDAILAGFGNLGGNINVVTKSQMPRSAWRSASTPAPSVWRAASSMPTTRSPATRSCRPASSAVRRRWIETMAAIRATRTGCSRRRFGTRIA
ncbi:hypothetical protein GCM10020258_39530 [Sphingomonas yabuuchiae]